LGEIDLATPFSGIETTWVRKTLASLSFPFLPGALPDVHQSLFKRILKSGMGSLGGKPNNLCYFLVEVRRGFAFCFHVPKANHLLLTLGLVGYGTGEAKHIGAVACLFSDFAEGSFSPRFAVFQLSFGKCPVVIPPSMDHGNLIAGR
jgi:hypothetical protein